MDFVAIDFETANESRSSACSVGVAVVQNNVIVRTEHWLIKPEPLRFSPFNSRLHGITEADMDDALTFSDTWKQLAPIIDGQIVVAHNAPFDMSVLRRTLEHHGLTCPNLKFLCTYRVSQCAFPELGCYQLNFLCHMLDIPLNHHNAESDAAACAQVLCKIAAQAGIQDFNALENYFRFTLGKLTNHGSASECYEPCRSQGSLPTSTKRKAKDYCSISPIHLDEDFNGKHFVFTGTLYSMPRSKAFEVVASGGGIPQEGVNSDTAYLVVGVQDLCVTRDGVSGKMKKAFAKRDKGSSIQIIGEDDFLQMIDEELYAKCLNNTGRAV